jgi:hypothetical protein
MWKVSGEWRLLETAFSLSIIRGLSFFFLASKKKMALRRSKTANLGVAGLRLRLRHGDGLPEELDEEVSSSLALRNHLLLTPIETNTEAPGLLLLLLQAKTEAAS